MNALDTLQRRPHRCIKARGPAASGSAGTRAPQQTPPIPGLPLPGGTAQFLCGARHGGLQASGGGSRIAREWRDEMARETSTAHHAGVPVGGPAQTPLASQSSARCFSLMAWKVMTSNRKSQCWPSAIASSTLSAFSLARCLPALRMSIMLMPFSSASRSGESGGIPHRKRAFSNCACNSRCCGLTASGPSTSGQNCLFETAQPSRIGPQIQHRFLISFLRVSPVPRSSCCFALRASGPVPPENTASRDAAAVSNRPSDSTLLPHVFPPFLASSAAPSRRVVPFGQSRLDASMTHAARSRGSSRLNGPSSKFCKRFPISCVSITFRRCSTNEAKS
jgi:hypothetical protein